MIKDIIKKLIRNAGFRIERIHRYDGGRYHSRIVKSLKIPDLDIYSSAVESIPGMVERDFGKMLYMLFMCRTFLAMS